MEYVLEDSKCCLMGNILCQDYTFSTDTCNFTRCTQEQAPQKPGTVGEGPHGVLLSLSIYVPWRLKGR